MPDTDPSDSRSPTRRVFLARIWKWSARGLAAGGLFLVGSALWGGRRRRNVINLGPNAVERAVREGGFTSHGLFVLPSIETPAALVLRCTHLGCALTTLPDNDGFACPCHASRFDAGGRPVAGPAARPMDRVPLHLVGRDWIARMDEAGRG